VEDAAAAFLATVVVMGSLLYGIRGLGSGQASFVDVPLPVHARSPTDGVNKPIGSSRRPNERTSAADSTARESMR
jgi:hypothetical protein